MKEESFEEVEREGNSDGFKEQDSKEDYQVLFALV